MPIDSETPAKDFCQKQVLAGWQAVFQNTGDPEKDTYWNITQAFKTLGRWTLVSCWHESAAESAAMWKCYNTSPDGIAVKTSYRRLRKSLIGPEERVHRTGGLCRLRHPEARGAV